MSIQDRVERFMVEGEPLVAVGSERFRTNVQNKTSRTSQRIGGNRRRVTTTKWKEISSDGIPVVLTDRRMVRLGEAVSTLASSGHEVHRLYRDHDHQVPYAELRRFETTRTKAGLEVVLEPLVGRSTTLTIPEGDEPRRLVALELLAKQFDAGSFALDASRRAELAAKGRELAEVRDGMRGAIAGGRLGIGVPLLLVVGMVLVPFALIALYLFADNLYYQLFHDLPKYGRMRWPDLLMTTACLGVSGLGCAGALGLGTLGGLGTLLSQRREKALAARMRELQGGTPA